MCELAEADRVVRALVMPMANTAELAELRVTGAGPIATVYSPLLGAWRPSGAARRLGGTKAKCAVGRSILVIIWHLLADRSARFTDLGPGWHDEQAGRDRKIRNHPRQLKALGLDVTVNPAAA
jgi:hypothetical protein